jgi:hypothetical protein
MADLPFLRTSERKSFKRCPQAWKWRYVDWLVPVREKGGALWFGTGIHLALEHWYIPGTKRGKDPRETWKEFVGERIEHTKTLIVEGEKADGELMYWEDSLTLGDAILANYLKEYGGDEKWEVISPEQTAKIKIPHPRKKGAFIVIQVATFDLVARDLETGQIWLWDHKTATSIKVSHLWNDDQAGAYWAIAPNVLRAQGRMKPREKLRGIMYNFIMKSDLDTRPVNADGLSCNKPKKEHYVKALVEHLGTELDVEGKPFANYSLALLKDVAVDRFGLTVFGDPSEKQPAERFRRHPEFRSSVERVKQIEKVGNEAIWMGEIKAGRLPVVKAPDDHCGFCEFKDLCDLDEKDGDTEEYIDLMFRKEDPYAAHRKKAS